MKALTTRCTQNDTHHCLPLMLLLRFRPVEQLQMLKVLQELLPNVRLRHQSQLQRVPRLLLRILPYNTCKQVDCA